MPSLLNNVSILNATRNLSNNQRGLDRSFQKLATGMKINRAADNPAGLISSENLRAALQALEAESRSLQRTDRVAAVADGGLSETSGLLNEAKSLALANANTAGLSQAERDANQLQIDSILSSVDRVVSTTTFSGNKLLDGSGSLSGFGESLDIESTATTDLGEAQIEGQTFSLADIGSGKALSTADGNVVGAMAVIDNAIGQINTQRGRIGGFQKNTIEAGINTVAVGLENIAAAESSIRDTDYAADVSALLRSKLLSETSITVADFNTNLNDQLHERVLTLID